MSYQTTQRIALIPGRLCWRRTDACDVASAQWWTWCLVRSPSQASGMHCEWRSTPRPNIAGTGPRWHHLDRKEYAEAWNPSFGRKPSASVWSWSLGHWSPPDSQMERKITCWSGEKIAFLIFLLRIFRNWNNRRTVRTHCALERVALKDKYACCLLSKSGSFWDEQGAVRSHFEEGKISEPG